MFFFRLERFLLRASEIFLYAGALATVVMMLNIVADVASRSILNIALPGTIELVSSWYMAGFVFLPIAHIQASRRHIYVELLTEPLPPRARRGFEVLGLILAAVIFFVVCIVSAEQSIRATRIAESWDAMSFQIPIWPTRWFVTLACGLAGLICLVQIVTDSWFVATGREMQEAWEHANDRDFNI